MKKYVLLLIIHLLLFITDSVAQNKSGYTWIFGASGGAYSATFIGDTSRPSAKLIFDTASVFFPNFLSKGHSNICDSATGKLLFMCNGMRMFDTLGNVMENGDSLQPNLIYDHYCCPSVSILTQNSIILPKGSNGLYYVFTPTMTDSAYTTNVIGVQPKAPFDLMQYHVVDMNANAGLGKVVQKNVEILSNVEIAKVGMMACRHANGYDWWLLKQALDTNMIYTFLVTADTVELKLTQGFSEPKYSYLDFFGQSCFSTDGSKYAFIRDTSNTLFLADFNRCTGVLSNPNVIKVPIDSTTIVNPLPQYVYDIAMNGICFSPNDSLIYLTKNYNIYQYELNEPDSALAWYRVKHGEDTTLQWFTAYGQMQLGIDNRIYIGHGGSGGINNSVIDNPNVKGIGCSFCRKCFVTDPAYGTSSPPNMPNFNLGPKLPCWPLGHSQLTEGNNQLEVYPNPTSAKIFIKSPSNENREFYDSMGQLLFTTMENEINITQYSKGIYYLKVESNVKKIAIE